MLDHEVEHSVRPLAAVIREVGMETWKAVVGYAGLYEVSDTGNVRSLEQKADQKKHGTFFVPKRAA